LNKPCGDLLPPALAARFTLAETAVLAVIAAETRKRSDCRLTNGELADVAGVSITTVKNALRAARALNLLSVEERRLTAFRNDSNVVRIVSSEWRAWLRLAVERKSVPASPPQIKHQTPAQRSRGWAAKGQGSKHCAESGAGVKPAPEAIARHRRQHVSHATEAVEDRVEAPTGAGLIGIV
jgi:hypothetical protein